MRVAFRVVYFLCHVGGLTRPFLYAEFFFHVPRVGPTLRLQPFATLPSVRIFFPLRLMGSDIPVPGSLRISRWSSTPAFHFLVLFLDRRIDSSFFWYSCGSPKLVWHRVFLSVALFLAIRNTLSLPSRIPARFFSHTLAFVLAFEAGVYDCPSC